MPDWVEVTSVYSSVSTTVDLALIAMFSVVGDVFNTFSMFLTAMAAIYIALTGFALMSGTISMSTREMATKFGKLIFILFLFQLISGSGGFLGLGFFNTIWEIPEAIGSFFVDRMSPFISSSSGGGILALLGLSSGGNQFDAFMDIYATNANVIASEVSARPGSEESNFGLVTWIVLMAPLFLTTISIFIAKFVSAVLFLIAPIVFGFSLFGFKSNFLTSWFKSLAVTFLTAILVFIIGSASLSIVTFEMFNLIGSNGVGSFLSPISATNVAWSLPAIAPVGILALLSLMLLTQAASIASSIVGVAATNSQQATGFIQIGALQAASRGAPTP